jgi:hypothetical protein
VTPVLNTAPEAKLLVIEGVPQLSVAVGGVHSTVADAIIVSTEFVAIFVGQFAMTGAVVSIAHGFATVIVNEQAAVLCLILRGCYNCLSQ